MEEQTTSSLSHGASNTRYEELFTNEAKIAAFDAIAAQYFNQNFGTFPKAELDLFMFSQYIDRIYAAADGSDSYVSDYALSKELGLTQGRIRSLKERKEIKYPSSFDWRSEFRKVVSKAECDGEKIKLYVRDDRLYTELCNEVERIGGYSEMTLTRKLLVVSPPMFIDLMLAASDGRDRNEATDELRRILSENGVDFEALIHGEQSFWETLKDIGGETLQNVLETACKSVPFVGGTLSVLVPGITKAVRAYLKHKSRSGYEEKQS